MTQLADNDWTDRDSGTGDRQAVVGEPAAWRFRESGRKFEQARSTVDALAARHALVSRLTALCGELLGADGAFYAELDSGTVTVLSRWQNATDSSLLDLDLDDLCVDLLGAEVSGPLVLNELILTPYARAGNGLRLGLAQTIRRGARLAGGLGVLYRRVRPFEDDDKRVLRLLAALMARLGRVSAAAPRRGRVRRPATHQQPPAPRRAPASSP